MPREQARPKRQAVVGRSHRAQRCAGSRRACFEFDDPKHIAASLKRSAEASSRRKAEPFQSAMSMLTFYVNRAGKNLSDDRRAVLEKAKDELRHLYGRE